MKRIIDIPEEEIKRICENGVVEHIYLVADAIKDSIPLSECRAEDCISREDTYNTMRLMMDNATIGDSDDDGVYESLEDIKEQYLEIVKGMSNVEPEIIDWNNCHTPEQLESIRMTREVAIEELKILKEDYWDDDGYGHETKQYDDTMLALEMAIKALEQQPCDDAISRQAVCRLLVSSIGKSNTYIHTEVLKLPSVTPQEPFINKPCVSSGVCEHDKNKVLDKIDEIITDALDKSTDQKESQTLRWVLDKISEVM